MTITIDNTWDHQGGSMYYKSSQRRWVCLDCEYDTKSPYGAGCHATSHGITLPNRRKEKPVKIEVPVNTVKKQPTEESTKQLEIPKKEEKFNPDTLWPLYKTVEKPRFSPKIEPEDPHIASMKKKIEIAKQIQALQLTGVYPPEEIEKLKIKYGLKEKPQPPPDYSMMMYLMMQNAQRKSEPSFFDIFLNAFKKATLEKMKQEELSN